MKRRNILVIYSCRYKFNVKATYRGYKESSWTVNGKNNRNHYVIAVECVNTSEVASFDFWMSIAKPRMKEPYDIGNAFYSFVNDALCGLMSIDEFFSEFGYELPSEAIKVHDACKKALDGLTRLLGVDENDDILYDLVNDLSEQYG